MPRSLQTTAAVVATGVLMIAGNAAPAAAQTATAGQLLISEFRLRGPGGANDEYIEIYNNSGAGHTVTAASGTGYGIAASDGMTRCSIPNGTVIPAGGHYLCVNNSGYSLSAYPAGKADNPSTQIYPISGANTAAGDASYGSALDIPDNAGLAIFNNDGGGAGYSLANRLDAVGSTSEANTLYKEGSGYPALMPASTNYAFHRDACGKGGSMTIPGPCPVSTPRDTDDNASDFILVDANSISAAGARLGAPGPENRSSPVLHDSAIGTNLLDTCVAASVPPNRTRDLMSDPANQSTFGTLDIRRTFTNNSGSRVTRLRFRIIDLTTFPVPGGFADLRLRSSTSVVVTVDRPPCGSGTSNVTVNGTTLEQPPAQPNGGGLNSSYSAGTISLDAPLAIGASIDLRFLLGIQQTGVFRIFLAIEAQP